MIPIRDSARTRTFPIVNTTLILTNIMVFVWMLSLTQAEMLESAYGLGLIPAQFGQALSEGRLVAAVTPLVTYQFLHGGWFHLIGNMLYLWVFGDNVEDNLGHIPYLFFYLVVGGIAGFAQFSLDSASTIPIVGASGAVAGILGAYLLLCPNARVLTIIPIFFFVTLAEFRAVFFLIFWFVLQIFNGIASIGIDSVTVAWWAHIGGFLAGVILIKLFVRKSVCEEK
jgi:membrane associated rhomboid family serine protease